MNSLIIIRNIKSIGLTNNLDARLVFPCRHAVAKQFEYNANYLSQLCASQRFGNPVVSVSNIKYIIVIEQVATFSFTKMNFKFSFFFSI
jgi:hypothetical protein